ncbi:hypothetical protein [Nocardia asteroides]|nr:hypothetical protein [Nocardia asteroides]SFN22005.1 hypothetical protein SAMN05444423_107100 [Nocardia asteroides]VEG37181.1 Uncharacterised protein [Nocardia asteroides]
MVAFITSASLVTLVLVVSVYTISADYMQSQRERTVDRAVGVHAELLRWRLDDPNVTGEQALAGLNLSTGAIAMLRWDSRWSIVDADGGSPGNTAGVRRGPEHQRYGPCRSRPPALPSGISGRQRPR